MVRWCTGCICESLFVSISNLDDGGRSTSISNGWGGKSSHSISEEEKSSSSRSSSSL